MTQIPLNLATEDELSETVLLRMLSDIGRYSVGQAYRQGGFGYLRRTIRGWNAAAPGVPFLVLTDLDNAECPASLTTEWLPAPRHPNLIFRVAVREVESWLLADPVHLSEFLRVPRSLLPESPDEIPDPKQRLIEIAKRSRKSELREGLVPRTNSTARQGPDYNGILYRFVSGLWNPAEAARNSPSLDRTYSRLLTFKPRWSNP